MFCLFGIVGDLGLHYMWHQRLLFGTLGYIFVSFLYFGEPWGSSLASLGAILATLGFDFDVFLALWDEPGSPGSPSEPKA